MIAEGRLHVRVMTRRNRRLPRISKARLEEMIEQATVDAYDESEQITGWFTMIDENLASAVRDHGAWNSGYRRTPRREPERANCRCLQAGARSPVAPHSRSAATHAAAGRRGVDRSISSVACRRMTDMGACWPISRLAQAPSAPAAAAASSARVPRRQNAGWQADARGCARLFILVSFVPHNWPRRRSDVQETWSEEWQDLNLRPPRPERGVPPLNH